MTSLITRCPKCATAFNVTEAHLNTANGAVRCGSCLNVFNGRENLTQSLTKQSVVSSLLDDDDDLLISDDLELDSHNDQESEINPTAPPRVSKTFNNAEANESEAVDDDESWALKLLEDEGHDPAHLGLHQSKNTNQPVAPTSAESAGPTTAKSAVIDKTEDIETKLKSKSSQGENASKSKSSFKNSKRAQQDETKTQDVDTAKPKPKVEEKSTDEPAPITPEQPTNENEISSPTAAALKAEEYVAAKTAEPEPAPEIAEDDLAELQKEIESAKKQSEPTANEKPDQPQAPRLLVDAIEVEAVELQYSAKRPKWFSRLVWMGLASLATLVLVGQVAWLKFDELSLKEPYRQYYVKACELLGCELPTRKDLSEIRTSNLLVRTHPNSEGALLADVVLQNYAEFEQPFPKLALIFSNIKNKVVASRSFEPSEYLGGDLAGATMMPSLKAIHISLELVDPGKGAVSYKIVIEE